MGKGKKIEPVTKAKEEDGNNIAMDKHWEDE